MPEPLGPSRRRDMKVEQLEAWVLAVVDQVPNGHRVEDSRVELKSSWPIPAEAARRIAGHANASGGAPIPWIIGLDEQRGVVPFASTTDLNIPRPAVR